jgi:hypothetical protein
MSTDTLANRPPVDLNTCVPGQFLRTVHGTLLIYVGRRVGATPYSHEVKYAIGNATGTRLDDGSVFAKNRMESDEDVSEILPLGWETTHLTKEGIEVKIGQCWRDLDKRMNGRCVQVVDVVEGRAVVQHYSKFTGATGTRRKLSISRMHRHSTGWALVREQD